MFNADEFFLHLGQNANWTWARRGARSVALRESKLGFTGCLVISADGTILKLVLHWMGTSDRCHASVDFPHPLLEQAQGPFGKGPC